MTRTEASSPIRLLVDDLREVMHDEETRRAGSRLPRLTRRGGVITTAVLLGGVAVAAAAGVGVFTVEHTARYDIRTRPSEGAGLCLTLAVADRGPIFGCGNAPSADAPLGLLVVGPDREGSRVVYGVAASNVVDVRISGKRVRTHVASGVPGRLFSTEIRGLRHVQVAAFDAAGASVGRLGGIPEQGAPPATSRAEAQRRGDLAGFAATVEAPGRLMFEGREIAAREAVERKLVCLQDDTEVLSCKAP